MPQVGGHIGTFASICDVFEAEVTSSRQMLGHEVTEKTKKYMVYIYIGNIWNIWNIGKLWYIHEYMEIDIGNICWVYMVRIPIGNICFTMEYNIWFYIMLWKFECYGNSCWG